KCNDIEQVLDQRHQTDNNFKEESTDINH
ncbi:bifunctional phosphoribosyl-AMP cyclohydrolase/phosphoribosyl-ATP diphosphatase, partial [Staphylococcus shinii]